MNDKELEELNRNVQCAGICREKYIRCALMGITIHPRAPDSCKELARQVAAVGNNLNQLARIANFSGKAEDAYLVTGNIRHFPLEPYIVTPRQMLDIIIGDMNE